MVASADFDPIVVEPQLTPQKVQELLTVGRESAKLDYKLRHNPSLKENAVELTKDLVAMANTAGGYIVIGVDNGGSLGGLTDSDLALLDEATVRGQVETYLGTSLELFLNPRVIWSSKVCAIFTVLRSPRSPLVFEKDGQYADPRGSTKSVTAFRAGDIFVRHGSKSERWNQNDVRTIYARVVEREKERWLSEVLPEIRRLIAAAAPEQPPPVPEPSELLNQDAETFERTLRDLIRRSR